MAKKGSLIVISGFSGVGKGTVVKKMVAEYGYSLSVSATTRAPREGEVDGREYYFKSVDEFRNLIDYNGFIEWAQYVENYYGTPRKFVEDEMAKGHDVILERDECPGTVSGCDSYLYHSTEREGTSGASGRTWHRERGSHRQTHATCSGGVRGYAAIRLYRCQRRFRYMCTQRTLDYCRQKMSARE